MAHPTDEDEELDFINSLPSTLDTALNDTGTSGTNSIYKPSASSSMKEFPKFFQPKLSALEPKEEMLLHRNSMSISPNVSDASPTSSESSTSPLLRLPHPSQISSIIKQWTITLAHFWRRNRGLWLVLLSQVFSALMNTTTRVLETEEALPPFSVLFIRMGITVLLSVGYMWWKGVEGWPLGDADVRKLLNFRGILGFFGIFGMYYSLKYLPLADATVITFLAPSVTGYTSHLLLHSPFTRVQQMASFVALMGVLLIARPTSFFSAGVAEARSHVAPSKIAAFLFQSTDCNGTTSTLVAKSIEHSSPTQRLGAVGVALLGVLGSGGAYTTIRAIGTRAHPLISVNYFAAYSTLLAAFALAIGPMINSPELILTLPSSLRQWSMLLFIGIIGFIVQYLLTSGLAHEKSNRATDMIYTNMLWALILDKMVFGTVPPWSSVIGSLLILGSALFAAMSGGKGSGSGSAEERGLVGGIDGIGEDEEDEEGGDERVLLGDMRV